MFVLLHGESVRRTIAMACVHVCLFVHSCLSLTRAIRCPFRPSITHSSLCAFVKTPATMPSNDVVDENRTLRFISPFTACTLFASEIDDCLWICCFSCPFNQMALNDDRDLRWMQEIYFQTFSQCVPCPQRCVLFPLSSFSLSPLLLLLSIVCQCASVCMFLFLPSVCTSNGRVPVGKGETKWRNKNLFYPQHKRHTTLAHTERQCQRTLSRKLLLKFIQRGSFHVTIKLDIHRFVDFSKFDSLFVVPRSVTLVWILPCAGALASTLKTRVSKHFLIAFSYRFQRYMHMHMSVWYT